MNYGDMQTFTRRLLNDTGTTPNIWTDTVILPFMNAAQTTVARWIEEEDEDYFLTFYDYTVVAVTDHSDQSFNLQSNFRRHKSFERQRTNSRPTTLPVVPFLQRDIGAIIPGPNYDSVPVVAFSGTTFVVCDSQEAFTLRQWYSKRLTDFTATGTTTTTDIPTEYHDLLCWTAARDCFFAEGNMTKYNMAKEMAETQKADLKRNISSRQVQMPITVRRTHGY